MAMTYYAIRHRATGQLMPQSRRNRGYSHWNPSADHKFDQALTVPRLLENERTAQRCIAQWAVCPNGKRSGYQSFYDGEWEETIDFKDDGRKRDDLEAVRLKITVVEKKRVTTKEDV